MNDQKTHSHLDTTISVVVPVYNGEKTLSELTKEIESSLKSYVNLFEIIFVNDGSSDNSWEVILELADQKNYVRGYNLMTNFGQHNALLAGITEAQYSIILTIDDDLQHPPEEIPRLLKTLHDGYDVVYGRPKQRNHSFWRNVSSKILKTVLKVVLGAEMGGHSSAFRAFRSDLTRGFKKFNDAQLSIDVLLSWSASKVTHIQVGHNPRKIGNSGYTFKKLASLAFNMLTGYSVLPLRIASGLGFIMAFFGVGLFLYVVIKRLLQANYVPGFTFIAAETALFAGLQLFAIGIIGEYIARLHFRTMGKPPYVIRDEIDGRQKTN